MPLLSILRPTSRFALRLTSRSLTTSQAFDGATAEAYALIFESAAPSWQKHVDIIAESSPSSAVSILDLGSGPGEPACTFKARFPEAKVFCTDVAPDMIEKAQARAAAKSVELDFAVCGGDDLSQFSDGSFDFVTMNMTLMFVPDRVKCLEEAKRVLKPGGKVLSTVWKTNSFMQCIGATMAKMLHPKKPEAPPPINPMALAADNAQEELAAAAGLTVERAENYDITMYCPSEEVTRAAVRIPMGPKLAAMEEEGVVDATARFTDLFIETAPEVGVVKDAQGGFPIAGTHQMIVLAKAP